MLCCIFSAPAQDEKAAAEKPSADILSSLFDEKCDDSVSLSKPSTTIDAHGHSIYVYYFPATIQQWDLQCAYVHIDKLLVIARKDEHTVLNVYHASSSLKFGEHQLPKFPNHPFLQQEISSLCTPSSRSLRASIEYSPVLSLLCCQSSWKKVATSSATSLLAPMTDVFFHQLFGIEISLAQSTVALIGSQTGSVIYVDIRGYCTPPSSSDQYVLSNTLCCLDQPVIALHALFLPTSTNTELERASSLTAANALLIVGRFGKLVLFTEAESKKEAPIFTEFHIPGPILSSLSVKDHSIAFSRLRGIYRVCLEPECILKSLSSDTDPTNTVIIPRTQLRSPVYVCPTYPSFILASSLQTVDGVCTIKAITIDGRVLSVNVRCCQNVEQEPEGMLFGRDLKGCMSSIKNTNEQTIAVRARLQKVNLALVELNKALSILLTMQSSKSQCKPFSCTIKPVTERVGVNHLSLYAEVELCYNDVGQLGKGWILCITTHCTASAQSMYTSLSLEGLTTNDCLRHRINLQCKPRIPVRFTVTSSLLYTGTHFQSNLKQHPVMVDTFRLLQPTGVSVMVATCVFDVLDFLQAHRDSSLKLLLPLSSPAHITLPETLERHCFEIFLPLSEPSPPSGTESCAERCREFLRLFLPHHIIATASTNTNGCVQIQTCNYNGSKITFEVADTKKGKMCVSVATTDSMSDMVEIISSVHHRVWKIHKNDGSPTELLSLIQVCMNDSIY